MCEASHITKEHECSGGLEARLRQGDGLIRLAGAYPLGD